MADLTELVAVIELYIVFPLLGMRLYGTLSREYSEFW